MKINRAVIWIVTISLTLVITFLELNHAESCEPEKFPPPPEILWPPDQGNSIPSDTAVIIKDFKSLSPTPHKLNLELKDSTGAKVEYELKRYQSRRSVYNYEAGFVFVKPKQNLKSLETYTFTLIAKEGFAGPVDEKITFTTGDGTVVIPNDEKVEVSYYFSEPGYYLSNCQTATWDKATSLFFLNSKVDVFPLLLVLDSNLLKDVSFFHSSMKKRDLALLFLPNEKGMGQCFDLSAFAVNGKRVFSEKICKPDGCVEGRHLSKEEAESKYKEHGAFGFSLIEFPAPEKEIPSYCAPFPPLCREYWSSISSDKCEDT